MKMELELGKRYTWKEVQDAYPDKWVRMNSCNFGRGDSIIDGILVNVCNDDDDNADDIWIEVWEGKDNVTKNDRFRRTTFGIGIGVIDCLNAKMEVRDEP